MKKYHAWSVYIAFGILGGIGARAADVQELPADAIVARAADSRIWKRVRSETLPNGQTALRTNSVIELASGLSYFENGEWKDSRDEIDVVPTGAAATKSPHKLHLSGNVNTFGAVAVTTPEDQTVSATVLCLAYADENRSAVFARIRNSDGLLLPPNQVVYPDAFTGGVVADVRVTSTKASVESDVILRTRLPAPADVDANFNPETVFLEVWHEFAAQEPDKRTRTLGETTDDMLIWGSMRMGRGTAFALDAPLNRASAVPVSKTWINDEQTGRKFLIERVRYKAIQSELLQLPAMQAALPQANRVVAQMAPDTRQRGRDPRLAALSAFSFPKNTTPKPVQTALLPKPLDRRKGLVLDWTLCKTATNACTFESGMTYLVSGTFNSTNTTFESAVIKYATTNTAVLQLWDTIEFKTDAYRPVICTSQQDRTVGEDLYASGASTNYSKALTTTAENIDYHHLRISYADLALQTPSMKLRNAQFVHCVTAIETDFGTAEVDNVLMNDVGTAFVGQVAQTAARHVTINQCAYLTRDDFGAFPSSLAFTNSLLVNVSSTGNLAFTTNYTVVTTSNIFTTLGGGAHYLAEESPYRDAGTTNIPSALADDLKKKTTYPPTVLAPAGAYTGQSQTLNPDTPRDFDLPDLGYHYDPIDFAIGPTILTNATFQVNAGTALAFFNPSNTANYGLVPGNAGKLYCDGRPDAKVNLVAYNNVQEAAQTNWAGPLSALVMASSTFSTAPEVRCRFTDVSVPGREMFNLSSQSPAVTFYLNNCEFHGGTFANNTWQAAPAVILTNCLFDRVYTSILLDDSTTHRFHNCTYYGGIWETLWGSGNVVSFTDNLFAGTEIHAYTDITNSHIGYTTNCIGRLISTNTNDVVVTSLTFQTGALGRFYLPTNSAFTNRGSMNATNAGLYHYTTATNQVKETNSVVDIGFHYVSADANGIPLDSDSGGGDGLADYSEDRNGNGSVDTGETSWQNHDTDGDGIRDGLEVLQGRNPLGGTLADTNNILNLRVFTPLK